MRLAIFFLFCVGLAAAVPLHSSDFDDLDEYMLQAKSGEGIGEKLKEHFENIIEKFKKAVEEGKGVQGDLWKRAEDFYQKLKDLGVDVGEKLKNAFEELRNKIGKNSRESIGEKLKEHLENIIERIKKAVEEGKGVQGDLWKKAEDFYEKLKILGVYIDEKLRNAFEELRNKIGKNAPISSNADISNIFDMFKRLKQLIKEKLDAEELKAKVEKIFGKGSELAEQIINMLREKGEKGKNKVLDWIDRIIPDKEERSISDVYNKLKEFFKDLQLDLKERFTKFGEWVKERYDEGLERGKTRTENIKRIAKEFIEDTKVIGKDMAEEARDFFRQYKQDLGNLYDEVVEKVRQIVKS